MPKTNAYVVCDFDDEGELISIVVREWSNRPRYVTIVYSWFKEG